MSTWKRAYATTLRRFAEGVNDSYRRSMCACRLYWWYLPAEGERWGRFLALTDGADAEPGWELATPEPLPWHLDDYQLTRWLEQRASALPIIGREEVPA